MDDLWDHAHFDINESFTRWLEPSLSPVIRQLSKHILEEAYPMSFVGDVPSHIYLRDSTKFGIGGFL
jgi:hypothetical protein